MENSPEEAFIYIQCFYLPCDSYSILKKKSDSLKNVEATCQFKLALHMVHVREPNWRAGLLFILVVSPRSNL